MKPPVHERLKNFVHYTKNSGVKSALGFLLHELWFDYFYGIQTGPASPGYRQGQSLSLDGFKETSIGHIYQGSSVRVTRTAFKKIPEKFQGEVFVDFGCGKGRGLLIAKLAGFSKVIGIEYSARLCDNAKENIHRFCKKRKTRESNFEVVHQDAVEFTIPENARFFHIFHTFQEHEMKTLVARIIESNKTHPRVVYLIYVFPSFAKAVLEFKPNEVIEVGSTPYGPDTLIFRFDGKTLNSGLV